MYKLLNRFAWIIAIMIWLQFSLLVDRDWPFDDEWFITFVITLLIVKFAILSWNFIKTRLEFFAESLYKQYFNKSTNKNNNNNSIKDEQIETYDYIEVLPEISDLEQNLDINQNNPSKVTYEKESVKKQEIVKNIENKYTLYIKKFFSENLLAKLGSILVFLWVLFLLGLVYSNIWPVWKLIIWFAIWFAIYFSWVVLDQKGYNNEWKILLWAWILINFLVILSWRYLIWEDNFLSTWVTFLFLIFNTVFAVVTSLVYNSRTLLIFSFIFAFLNPLLIWGSSNEPSTIIGYSLIVASWWLYLSLKQKDTTLAILIFILSNILFIIAPFSTDLHWVAKLVTSTFISIFSIYTIYKLDINKVSSILIWSYVFISLLLWSWWDYIKESTSFISYMISLILFFGIGIFLFLTTSILSLVYILFAPILILTWVCFFWWLLNITIALALIVLIYLVWYNTIQYKLPNFLKYFFFIILWIYIFLTNSFLSIENISLSTPSFITILIVSFVFIFTSYYLSTKNNLEFLYSIWTIWWILTLAPIIVTDSNNYISFILSIIWISIFAVSNWILPFINKCLLNKDSNIKNLIAWIVTWLLFILYEVHSYWTDYFPWVTLGFVFLLLAIVYFFLAYSMLWNIWLEKVKTDNVSKNIIYSYMWASISVFSLAIAFIFSSYSEIITSIWLFEATIMFYFYNKTKESKIFVAWIILFMIWVFKLWNLVNIVEPKDFSFLIPFTLIYLSYLLNLKFLDFLDKWSKRVSHDILHIIWIWTLALLLLEIIPNTWFWWSILWISIFLAFSSIIYSYFNSNILKIFLIISLSFFFLLHIGESESIFRKIDNKNLEYLRVLQYTSTLLLWVWIYYWNKINNNHNLNTPLNISFAIYLLFISSIYVYDIFNSTFAVTIYWWVSAFILLYHWLSKDIIKYRTLWLYIISLTVWKIFLYDIWFWLDSGISRVLALIVLWVLFIIISTKYSQKYWNNLKWELSFDNFKPNLKESKNNVSKQNVSNNDSFIINRQIKDIEIWNTKSVQLIFKNKKINLRAVNLIKIVKLVINTYNDKTIFAAGELNDVYNYIKDNYKSDLSRDNYNKIITILERFIKEWWEIKLIEK